MGSPFTGRSVGRRRSLRGGRPRATLARLMADLPPDFEAPTARPGRPRRPAVVTFAGWVLVIAGGITGMGGLFYLAVGTGAATSAALAYAAFGVAELVTGTQVLRLSAAFRVLAMPIAAIGILLDVVGL